MSERLDIKSKLKFDVEDLTNPDITIAEIGTQLESLTNGLVKGVVNEYDGPIESYNTLSGMASLVAALGATQKYDIQNDLGEIGYQLFKFEFYLTSAKLPNYKFRIMFFEYGLGGYPVKIVLEQGLADEIFKKENAEYIFEIQTKNELEDTVTNILASKRILKVVQGLINVSLNHREEIENSTQSEKVE
jgi:hypothetical protein